MEFLIIGAIGLFLLVFLFLNVTWTSSAPIRERKITTSRAPNLKSQAVENQASFNQQADKTLRKKLRKYNLAFPYQPEIQNVSTFTIQRHQVELFDYAFTTGGKNASWIKKSGLLISFDGCGFPQFCVKRKRPSLSEPLMGGDEISENRLPDWVSTLTIKTSQNNIPEISKFIEFDSKLADIAKIPNFHWLFFDANFILLYFGCQLPCDNRYFSISIATATSLIDLYGDKIPLEDRIKNLKKADL